MSELNLAKPSQVKDLNIIEKISLAWIGDLSELVDSEPVRL